MPNAASIFGPRGSQAIVSRRGQAATATRFCLPSHQAQLTRRYKKLNFDFIQDIAPVASIAGGPYVMVINPSVPAKTAPEFIVYAKANPGKMNVVKSE